MPQYEVHFELGAFHSLDRLALLADQSYNLGDKGDWFGAFRGGLYGFYSRLYGVKRHYIEAHAWLPEHRFTMSEYHLASILFHMDSAIECFTFALNALGWIGMSDSFRDVTDAKSLRMISPADILGGSPNSTRLDLPQPGYALVFPSLQKLWHSNAPLLADIQELHDVSKHRRTTFMGGKVRMDPPAGFFEMLGIPEGSPERILVAPMEEIILMSKPKLPQVERTPQTIEPGKHLEDLVPAFAKFIALSGDAALADAHVNVPLTEKDFLTPS